MNAIPNATPDLVLAVGRVARAAADHHQRSSSFTMLAGVVGALIFVAGLWAMLHWVERLATRRRVAKTLFDELATAHGLSRADVNVLRAIARRHGFDEPALVFVRPDAFARAGSDESSDRLDALHRRLFAD